MDYGCDIDATQNEKHDFVMKIAKGKYRFEEIVDWINSKTKK